MTASISRSFAPLALLVAFAYMSPNEAAAAGRNEIISRGVYDGAERCVGGQIEPVAGGLSLKRGETEQPVPVASQHKINPMIAQPAHAVEENHRQDVRRDRARALRL